MMYGVIALIVLLLSIAGFTAFIATLDETELQDWEDIIVPVGLLIGVASAIWIVTVPIAFAAGGGWLLGQLIAKVIRNRKEKNNA